MNTKDTRWAGHSLNDVYAQLAKGWSHKDARAYFVARKAVLSTLPTCR